MATTGGTQKCHLLSIPVELRLNIYQYLGADHYNITIGSVHKQLNLLGDEYMQPHNAHGIAGLPHYEIPVIKKYCDKSMLLRNSRPTISTASATNTSMIASAFPYESSDSTFSGDINCSKSFFLSDSKSAAKLNGFLLSALVPKQLLPVCKQIYTELVTYTGAITFDTAKLYLTYPFGVLVAAHLHNKYGILKTIKALYISGTFDDPEDGSSPNEIAFKLHPKDKPRSKLSLPYVYPQTCSYTYGKAADALRSMLPFLLGPILRKTFKHLEVRIFYPSGEACIFSATHPHSPVPIIAHKTLGGSLDLKLVRHVDGKEQAGAEVISRPLPTGLCALFFEEYQKGSPRRFLMTDDNGSDAGQVWNTVGKDWDMDGAETKVLPSADFWKARLEERVRNSDP